MCVFFNKIGDLLSVLRYFCDRESKMSFVSSKKKLSYKSAAHLKDGIYKVSEFILPDVGKSNVQFVNVGSKLLLMPVYDEWSFFGETLDVYEIHCDGTLAKQNIKSLSIIK